jgi:threonine synthase
MNYICDSCGKKYSTDSFVFQCSCGGMLDLEDFEADPTNILEDEMSIFRYIKAMPFDESFTAWKEVTLGEGLTPLVPLSPDNPNILVKVDYMMPTLSFKDRGAAVLIAKAKEIGVKKVVQDSSGNAGTSIAAYASRAGIQCTIYVPEKTSPNKIKQISSYGAKVVKVKGSREDTAKACLEAAHEKDVFYASHVYNPFFYQGTKTYVYEIYEQLKGSMPEALVIPVGNGTLVLGAYYGLKDLLKAGLISKMPKIIALQSEKCAPIYRAFIEDKSNVEEVENQGTLAEGIAIAYPKRGRQILEAVKDTGGEIITAPEDKILSAKDYLAKLGFYVEPTTAATFAGYLEYIKNKPIEGKVVIPLCGSGLKSS